MGLRQGGVYTSVAVDLDTKALMRHLAEEQGIAVYAYLRRLMVREAGSYPTYADDTSDDAYPRGYHAGVG